MFVRFRKSRRRLKVYVVENARCDGKRVQLIVAYLGSIDERASAARVSFWEEADSKLKYLVNRIGGEAEAKRLRMVVGARIPLGPPQPKWI